MCVDADSRGDDKVESSFNPLHVWASYAAQGNPPRVASKSGLRGCWCMNWNAEVMRESIGRSHGKNCKGCRSVGQDLNNVVDCPIAAAREDRVASVGDESTRFLVRLLWRIC